MTMHIYFLSIQGISRMIFMKTDNKLLYSMITKWKK